MAAIVDPPAFAEQARFAKCCDASYRRQQPRADDFVFAERFKLGIGNSDDSQRVTQRIEHLGTVAFGVIGRDVMFHRHHDFATSQAVLRQVPGWHLVLDRSTRRVGRG